MDGREAMAVSGGSAPYYLQQHRGMVSLSQSSPQTGAFQVASPPGFRPLSNANIQTQPNLGSTFVVDPKHANFVHEMVVSSGVPLSEPVKKKRGRPRKYAPDGQVSLGLSPLPAKPKRSPGSDSQKRARGRPPGSGRKQQLALLGEWMNSSAGQAFSPHVISVGVGEDIVAKMLSFSQQRPRVLCILSGSGTVSSVTLRQPASSVPTVTYEGRFEILCLSGSYLLAEDGGPRNRTGGISASLSSPDGQVFGGGVATLIAASTVQVVVCSFVYGGSKAKNKLESAPETDINTPPPQTSNKSATPTYAPPTQNFSPQPPVNTWSGSRPVELRNPHKDIDLTRG